MKIIFCSTMFTEIDENIKNSKSPNSVSGHKYQFNIIKGLIENNCDVTVINIQRVRRYPSYKKIILKKQDFKMCEKNTGVTVGCLNVFALNYITASINVYRVLKSIVEKHRNEKIILMTFNTYLPQTIAMLKIRSRFSNVLLCDLIGDIRNPKFGILNHTKGIKGKLIRFYESKEDEFAIKFDCFVLLTSAMATALNIKNKPYIELECPFESMADEEMYNIARKDEGYMIFYAGELSKEYGVDHLVRAFKLIIDRNYKLILAGNGTLTNYIKKEEKEDSRIRYLGFITPYEVIQYQKKASVVISPRTTRYEYVKYSFPSKTMECLASGIPYIAHKMPSIPDEYDEYIFYPKDESDISLKEKIVEVCNLPQEYLYEHGKRARDFILLKKNSKVLTKKIVNLLLNMEMK